MIYAISGQENMILASNFSVGHRHLR